MIDTVAVKHCNRRRLAVRKWNKRQALARSRGVLYDFPWFTNRYQLKTMATPCSCSMCRNPRRDGLRTVAELRAEVSEAEQINEALAEFWADDRWPGSDADCELFACNDMHPDQEDEVEELCNVEEYVRGRSEHAEVDYSWADDCEQDDYWREYSDYDDYRDSDWDEWDDWDDYDYSYNEVELQLWWNRGVSDPERYRCKADEVEAAYRQRDEEPYDGPEWEDRTAEEIAEWEAMQWEREYDLAS